MRSKSLNSTQIQDWNQIMVFEMVYLLVQQVFGKNHNYKGDADTHLAFLLLLSAPLLPSPLLPLSSAASSLSLLEAELFGVCVRFLTWGEEGGQNLPSVRSWRLTHLNGVSPYTFNYI